MDKPIFYPGIHIPSKAGELERCMVSVNVLEKRKSDFPVNEWILDSGAFTRVALGKGHMPVSDYATHVRRWSQCGNMLAAVAQDWMCEPWVLEITGLSVKAHQALTIQYYDALIPQCPGIIIMPVLQGFKPEDYVAHIQAYGWRLWDGQWVGVGSVCKRNASVPEIEDVLEAIHAGRPGLRLHGFGLKKTALQSARVCDLLHSSDSMAWSFAARRNGGGQNDVAEAIKYTDRINKMPVQLGF